MTISYNCTEMMSVGLAMYVLVHKMIKDSLYSLVSQIHNKYSHTYNQHVILQNTNLSVMSVHVCSIPSALPTW